MPRGRPRLYASNAERMRALRARRKAEAAGAQAAEVEPDTVDPLLPAAGTETGFEPPNSPPGPTSPASTAQSEPYDEEDYVLSGLVRRGREWAGVYWPELSSGSRTPFQDLLGQISGIAAEDPELGAFLERFPRELNPIDILMPFLRLFPGPHPSAIHPLPPGKGKKLTRRQAEVLRELAQNRTQSQAAERLGIAPSTTRAHVQNLLESLNASTTLEAIFKASAMGEAGLSLVDVIESLREGYPFDYRTLSYHVSNWRDPALGPAPEADRRLASFGVLLLLLALVDSSLGATARRKVTETVSGRGALLQYSPGGKLVRRWDCDGTLRGPGGLIFIPPRAEAHGFQPGNLLISDATHDPWDHNELRIVELTPEGHFRRSFTGGDFGSVALGRERRLAFARDGALLVGSLRADAVLRFTEGGQRVQRLIGTIPYGGVAVDRDGRVLVAGGWAKDSRLLVFSADGKRLLLQCGGGPMMKYRSVVVEGTTAYLANSEDCSIDLYSTRRTSGERVLHPDRRIKHPDLRYPSHLAVSLAGTLYVLDEMGESGDPGIIHALQVSTGRRLFTLEPPEGMRYEGLTAGPENHLYVTARAPTAV